MASTTEEDVIVESSNSPQVSNPGTPRSEMEARGTPPVRTNTIPVDMRNTPPPQAAPAIRPQQPQSKYAQLLAVIEDMGKDIRPTYSSSKTSAERLKRGIVHARILVRECLMECERSARN